MSITRRIIQCRSKRPGGLLMIAFLVIAAPGLCLPPELRAQDAGASANNLAETPEEKRERITAERFLELLKRSPRLGTALDKVYGYHVGRGTLDEFADKLNKDASEAEDGRQWMILGMVQMQRGQDSLAAQSLERAEALLPSEALPSYYLGKTLVLLGEVDKAADAMRRAIEKKPARADLLQVFQDLGRVYQRTGRNQEALGVWEQLESLFPGDAGVQEQIAAILAEEGAEEAALARYTKLATSTKDRFRQVEMAIRAAQLKARLGRSDEALADFEKQLGVVNPDSWLYRDVRRRIEEVFWSASDFDGLVKYYTNWTQEHPDDVDAMLRTARVLSIQKRTPEARTWFQKAIQRAPSNVEARQALVESLVTDNEYGLAAQEMERLVEIEPDNPDFIVRWGELVFGDDNEPLAERRQAAAGIWKRMLQTRGEDPVAVSRVADLLRGAELSEQAIELYRQAISLAENEPQYREYLGEYLHQLKRTDEALAVWEELASGTRRNRDNIVRLSEVLGTFGYDARALETMAEACEMQPTFGQRARYAELLREASRYDDALAQLDLAEPLADERELRELLISERIKNYQASGTLVEQIRELESAVAAEAESDPAAWRMLSLLREANRAYQPACDAIEKATELAGEDSLYWETAATLYERTGRFGEAVDAYRKLATIDRRFLTNYLTQIAGLEMRLGNSEKALETGEELLAAAPGNSENFRFFAGLCMQAGQADRGLDALRRNVRANPNDADALSFLAKTLADEFQTDEAIELYWRNFDLANTVDGKTPIIEALAELYLRTNRFDMLLDRLEIISREENKSREGTLWIAAAHQAAGDLGMARQLLEQLVREDSRDTKLLEQLVNLSKTEYDYESAAEYQQRLVAISPSPQGDYLLANLLMELGELDQAEGLWLKLASRGRGGVGASDLLTSVNMLVTKGQVETAEKLVERSLQKEPDNWELLAQAMMLYAKADKLAQALEFAGRVSELNVAPGEPTQKMLESIQRAAARANRTPGYDPYATLGTPSRTLSAISQIRAYLQPRSNDPFGYSSSRSRAYTPTCFGDVQAIAKVIRLLSMEDANARKEFIKEKTESALAGDNPDELWEAIAFQAAEDPNIYRYETSANADTNVQDCFNKLVEQGDADAAEMAIARLYNSRRQATQQASPKPMSDEELADLERLLDIAATGRNASTASYMKFWVVSELRLAGKAKAADEKQSLLLSQVKEPYELIQAASVSVQPYIYGNAADKEVAKMAFESAIPLLLRALELADSKSNNVQYIGSAMAQIIPAACEYADIEDAIKIADQALQLQARLTAEMRPSERERPQTGARMMYTVRLGGNYEQVNVTFPPPSGYFNESSITTLHALVESAKRNGQLPKIEAAAEKWCQAESDDAFLTFVRLMAKASIEYWTDQRSAALATLGQVDSLAMGSQFTSLMQARLLYDSGDVRGALQTIETLRPSNQQMLVDRELTLLQLVLQLGDLERAKKSAQKLFALRLDSNTEFKLADLMLQLGMSEMGDRMMSRIRRRAGGKQDTLVQLMQRYSTAGDTEAAVEIARQIVRRSQPAASPNNRTSDSVQYKQALQILVKAKQLEPLIERYESLVERSPKAMQLADKLASFYEAAGRRTDAQQLRLKLAESSPTDPRSLLAAAQQLAASGAIDQAVDKYVEAFRKSPDALDNSFYEMRTVFQKKNDFPKLVDMMSDEGFEKFASSYRMGEITNELIRAKQFEAANKVFRGVLESGDLNSLSNVFSGVNRAEGFKIDDDIAKIVADKICDASSQAATINYSRSRSSGGVATGIANYLVTIVFKNAEQLERVKQEMAAQLEKDESALFPRVILCLIYCDSGETAAAEALLEPLLNKNEKNSVEAEALWVIASQFVAKDKAPGLTAKILESFEKRDALDAQYSSQFMFSPANLLATAYENLGDDQKARDCLIRAMENMQIDERQGQYNPGYGEYQYIQSMDGLSQRLLQANSPAEAYIAYRKAFGDSNMLKRAERWGGGRWESRAKSLLSSIEKKMTPEVVLRLVQAATADESRTGQDIAKYLTAVEQVGSSMADARVAMPLEQFAERIKEDEKLKTAVGEWLSEESFGDEAKLSSLVSRLIVAQAVANDQLLADSAEQVTNWLEHHARPAMSIASRENPPSNSKDAAGKSDGDENKASTENTDSEQAATSSRREVLDQELLLAIAARNFPQSPESDNVATSMIDRAIAAAAADSRDDLAFGLRCQLARRVASHDKQRARDLLMAALDELLPREEKVEN